MVQADYMVEDSSYDGARDAAGLPARVAIFADRGSTRSAIAEDLTGAGFRCIDGGQVVDLIDGPITLLGDVVMVDCPVIDAKGMAALTRLDMRIARAGAQLIVATSINALDDVFAALSESTPQILVDPSRAERVVAVGRTIPDIAQRQVREMDDEDRLHLLRLSQQVDAIAQKLDRFSNVGAVDSERLSEFKTEWRGKDQPTASAQSGMHAAHPPLPDPGTVRKIIAARQARAEFFDEELFSDPAWDMLLDLTAAHGEHARVSVSSLCIASGVPATTALRWISQLVESGVFERIADPADKRRAFIGLSKRSLEGMSRYFIKVEEPIARAA